MKPNALIIFFCTAKFGYSLIHSNPKWFKYDLIWKKSRKVGFLSANRCPLRQHENIYVFKDKQGTYNPQKTKGKPYNKTNTGNNNEDESAYGKIDRSSHLEGNEHRKINKGDRHPTSIIDHENIYVFNGNNDENEDLINYSKKILKYIGKTKSSIKKEIPMADHFFRYSKANFSLPTKETYEKLIEIYKIDLMEDFIPFEDLETTYNPQKTEGTPYKNGAIPNSDNVYGTAREKGTVTKTDRHPSSIIPEYEGDTILIYKNPHKTIHRTQKPVELLEWLIKTYSNEEDTVMDFTMGSGTCGVACMNTNRKFIGVEKDAEIFELAVKRLKNNIKK